MRQAGAEYGRRAQRGYGHHRAKQCRPYRNWLRAPASLQRVPDADQHAGWRAGQGDRLDDGHRRRPRRLAPAEQPRMTHGGPGRQRDDRDDRPERAKQKDERVERHPPRVGAGEPCFAQRSQRREQRGKQHRPGRTRHRDAERAEQTHQHEFPRPRAERRQGSMVGSLGGRLPAYCLSDDRQSGKRGQASQQPPADGLRPDRSLHYGGVSVQVVGAEHIKRAASSCRRPTGRLPVPESHVVQRQQSRCADLPLPRMPSSRTGHTGGRFLPGTHSRPRRFLPPAGRAPDLRGPLPPASGRATAHGLPNRPAHRCPWQACTRQPPRPGPTDPASVRTGAPPSAEGRRGGTSVTRKLLASIGLPQDAQAGPVMNGARTGVTDIT